MGLNSKCNRKKYSVYSNVTDNWITNVYTKKYAEQTTAKKIDLYAVWQEIAITSIAFPKTSEVVGVSNSKTLTVNMTPSNAKQVTYTWTSSNTKVATVSNGTIKGIAPGTATITAKTPNGKTASITVTVKKQITVVFHKNTSDSDTSTATQYFVAGEAGNKFGYNNNGTAKWTTSGQFGKWDYANHTLKGWTKTKGSKKVDYSVYSGVSDNWINGVTNNYNGKIDLYAVWYENVDLLLFWGQSNMVGSVGGARSKGENTKDNRSLTILF